jgi:hypothetical protein
MTDSVDLNMEKNPLSCRTKSCFCRLIASCHPEEAERTVFRSATVEATEGSAGHVARPTGWQTEAGPSSPAGFRLLWSGTSLADPSVAATAPRQGHQSSGSFRMTDSVDLNMEKNPLSCGINYQLRH